MFRKNEEENLLSLQIYRSKKKLVFYPVPKNANSSAKYFLVKHCGLENKFKTPIDLNNVDQKLFNKNPHQKNDARPTISSFIPSKQKFAKVDADFKVCILREPFSRFISAYSYRVLFRKDPGFFEHSIDMVIKKLKIGKFENKHFLPQAYFLGKDLNYFNIVCCMNTLNVFEKEINNFFKKKITFPWIETKSSNLNLSKKQIDELTCIYEDDIQLFEYYKNNK